MKSTLNDRNLEKLKKLNTDILNRNYFDAKIENLYINEFEEQISKILILTEKEFISELIARMKLILEDTYSTFAFNNEILVRFQKTLDKLIYENYYLTNKKILTKGLSDVHSPKIITNFRKHCQYTSDEAIHISSCKGKMLAITNSKKNTTHLVCLTCKAAYLSNSILLGCDYCNIDYYTTILNNKDSLEYLPATWEKYHCGGQMNDQMRCNKCKELLFLRMKDYKLYCKKCKFEDEPEEIDWECIVCMELFRSPAKIFNPMEYKIIKLAVKDAIIAKEFAKPNENNCCKLNIENTKFYHTEDCGGNLFIGELNGKEIVVCDICRSFKEYENYSWTCPSCNKKFKSKGKRKLKNKRLNSEKIKEKEIMETQPSSSNFFLTPNKKQTANKQFLVTPRPKITAFIKTNDKAKVIEHKNTKNNEIDSSFTLDPLDEKLNEPAPKVIKKLSKASFCSSSQLVTSYLDKEKPSFKDTTNNIYLNVNVNNYITKNTTRDVKKNSFVQTKVSTDDSSSCVLKTEGDSPVKKSLQRVNSYVKMKPKNMDLEKPEKTSSNNNLPITKINTCIDKLEKHYDSSNKKIDNNLFLKMNNIINDNEPTNKPSESESKKNIKKDNTKVESNINNNVKQSFVSSKITTKIELTPKIDVDVTLEKQNDKKQKLSSSKIISAKIEINTQTDVDNTKKTDNNNNKVSNPTSTSSKIDVTSQQPENVPTKKKKLVFKEDVNIKEKENNEQKVIDEKEEKLLSTTLSTFNIEDLQIVQKIGEGTFGKIYSVKDNKNQRFGLKKAYASSPEEVKTFIEECELVNSLCHNHIVKMHSLYKKKLDTFTYAIYILMDLAQKDWDSEIKEKFAMNKKYYNEEELITIIKQLMEPLAFLQEKCITHRDIKPQNILVFKDKVYKICDFGEAKEYKNLKRQSTVRGTELYMSPLLYNGMKRNVDNITHNSYKSDLYSMGLCLLYAACLSYDPIYDMRDFSSSKETNTLIDDYVKDRYSDKFKDLIKKMLEYEERLRMDCIDFNKYLKSNY